MQSFRKLALAYVFGFMLLSSFTTAVHAQLYELHPLHDEACSECASAKSRWIAALPFGAGQFQNGEVEAGFAFAAAQTALLAGSISLYVLHDSLRNSHVPANRVAELRAEEAALRVGNWICAGLFASTVLAGIVQAQLQFGEHSALQVSPGGALARLRF